MEKIDVEGVSLNQFELNLLVSFTKNYKETESNSE